MNKIKNYLLIIGLIIPIYSYSAEGDKELLAEAESTEILLNKTLEKTIEKVRKNNKGYPMLEEWASEIRKSHESWLLYRENEINVVGHLRRNWGPGRNQTRFKIKLTKERIQHLRSYYGSR